MPSRRRFLIQAATASAFLGLQRAGLAEAGALPSAHAFPPPERDPRGIFDLPRGFSYTVLTRTGQSMDDGLLMPGDPDGMAAFDAGAGRIALVCNHELDPGQLDKSPFGRDGALVERIGTDRLFDAAPGTPGLGGTTTRIYDPATRRVERCWLSLAGTERNCAGGPTPWGAWLSCEETVARVDDVHSVDHGWVFEVPADHDGAVDPKPIRAMGRFNHEAVAVDPRTGIVYLTEDRHDGLFYRFVPDVPGDLHRGGRLQALAIDSGQIDDTRNWGDGSGQRIERNRPMSVRWIDLDGIDSPDDDLRMRGHAQGAAVFARGEGAWFGRDEVYFACTNGGPIRCGQIFRYRPAAGEGRDDESDARGTLELFVESDHQRLLKNCDNLTVAPWGDLIVCEDRPDGASLIGVQPDGSLYEFARNAYSDAELAGACFSPDGRTLFVNLQDDGLTLAISGAFPRAA
jgi:hypothetical protein